MHPVIVIIIVIAVTVAVVLGFVSYMLSVWTVQQHNFIVRPIVYARGAELSVGEPRLLLYVANEGARAVKIIRVEIVAGSGMYVNTTTWVIEPGERRVLEINGWVKVGNPSPIEPGNVYRVYVYTDELGRLMYDVVVG